MSAKTGLIDRISRQLFLRSVKESLGRHLAVTTRSRGGTTAPRSGTLGTLTSKQAQAEAYLQSFHQQSEEALSRAAQYTKELARKAAQEENDLAALLVEQERLLNEAGAITRSLYRLCIRSTKVLLPGNENDEADFREREEQQLKALNEGGLGADMFSMAPPVDRQNELESRAEYYHAYARENFVQESDCFQHGDLWREAQVDRYLYYIRNGEHQRTWIMEDYKFKDPYPDRFDAGRVDRFETQAKDLLRRTYSLRGWKFVEEIRAEETLPVEDDFDDDYDTDSTS